jgi:hypothetical protein
MGFFSTVKKNDYFDVINGLDFQIDSTNNTNDFIMGSWKSLNNCSFVYLAIMIKVLNFFGHE